MSELSEENESLQTHKEQKKMRKIASRRDRSKFKKTDQRKNKRLQEEQSIKKLEKEKELLRGRVLAIPSDGISVQNEENIYLCTLRGALKKEIGKTKNLLAVGDFVFFNKENSIVHIEQRYSILSRQDNLRQRKKQLIAVNIDQVLITVSIAAPSLKPHLVDRYIIATYKGNMKPIIVINKMDLLERQDFFISFKQTYEALEIPVIPVSAKTKEGIEILKKQMKEKASVFSGQSGVGKSSLINTVTDLSLPVKEVRRKTLKGVHTTSTTHLIPLNCGGWCVDTPGIRSLGIWDLKKEDLEIYFPEIQELSHECKYPNCTHSHEPQCVLKEALKKEEISTLRFHSYLKLLKEIK